MRLFAGSTSTLLKRWRGIWKQKISNMQMNTFLGNILYL